MAHQIEKNINVPEYVKAIESDFSTSTTVHKIVGKIVLMKSLQEYFEYMMCALCGIPALEMKGDEQDWKNLVFKVGLLLINTAY